MISDIREFKYSICSTYHVKYMYINKKKKQQKWKHISLSFVIIKNEQMQYD